MAVSFIKLIKKEISGHGYYHVFRNVLTKGIVRIKCTQKDYERMGEVGGARYNPTLDGHKWLWSNGGVPEIDGRPIKNGEMLEIDGKKIAKIDDVDVVIEKGDLDDDNNFVGTIKWQ